MLGANLDPRGGVSFSVWAPLCEKIKLRIVGEPSDREMRREGEIHTLHLPEARPGARYFYLLPGDRARPDPRSRFQPDGVHGPSQVIDPQSFAFRHPRSRRPLHDYVIYELHVGTFTAEGTFAAAARALPHLRALGVTAVELMPVAAFPGGRNWGYDGVDLYAPAAAYGTPAELAAFVDAAHELDLSVVLDVVYNHLGPEGNYLQELAPYFTDERTTLWGAALRYEHPEVRDFLIDNANAWLEEYRFDALRLDAVHAIVDPSPRHILSELAERTRDRHLIAETDMNQVRVFDEWGFDAAWSDDFHHALHACLTGERGGYYEEFGSPETLALAIEQGWVRGPEPQAARALEGTRFISSTQTHDQVGNRALGERLEHLAGAPSARLAAVALLAGTPAIPMLFQGEEVATPAPFLYFMSHSDPALVEAVRQGRRREFAEIGFAWPEQIPDPDAEETFSRSKLDLALADREPHAAMLRLYHDLLVLRRNRIDLGALGKPRCRATAMDERIRIERENTIIFLNLGREPARAEKVGRLLLHSESRTYGGTLDDPTDLLPPRSAAVYTR